MIYETCTEITLYWRAKMANSTPKKVLAYKERLERAKSKLEVKLADSNDFLGKCGDHFQEVDLEGGYYCSCPSFQFSQPSLNGSKPPCIHLWAIAMGVINNF